MSPKHSALKCYDIKAHMTVAGASAAVPLSVVLRVVVQMVLVQVVAGPF